MGAGRAICQRAGIVRAVKWIVAVLLGAAVPAALVALALDSAGFFPPAMALTLCHAVILGVPRLFELTAKIAWDRYLGELSYPLYICHFLFGWILLPESISSAYLAIALSLLASILIYRFLEAPIDRWRQSRFDNRGARYQDRNIGQAAT